MRDRLLTAIDDSPAAFTDIRFERRTGTCLRARRGTIEEATTVATAVGVARTLSPGCAWGAATFSAADRARGAVRRAHELSLLRPVRPGWSLAPEPARDATMSCPAGRDPREVAPDRKRALVERAARLILGADRRIVDCIVRYEDALVETLILSSEGCRLFEARPEYRLAVLAVAGEEGSVERAIDSMAAPAGVMELEQWVETLGRVALRAVEALRARPLSQTRLPVVLDPRMTGVLAHRVVGHLALADDARGRGPLPLGTRLGPDLLTVGDDGSAAGLGGTQAFDHEGIAARNTILIRHGVVVGHLHTRTSAALHGTATTGNARAATAGLPGASPTNTYVANGRGDLEGLLRDLDEGVYLTDPIGATMAHGHAALRSGMARMIRRGELAEAVKGVTITGDALALFGQIDRIAGDFAWDRSAAACARAGAAFPVGTGAPHVRLLEVRLG